MSRFQTRILRIINISPDIARAVYSIPTIKELIDKQCNNIRIIKDSEHPITKKLIRNVRSKTTETHYRSNTANTEEYSNSFLQKHMIYIRDGTHNLYKIASFTNKNLNLNQKPKSSLENLKMPLKVIKCNEKPLLKCQSFGELKKPLKHIRDSRLCISKQIEYKRPNFN